MIPERFTITLETFFELLEHVYNASQVQFSTQEMEKIHKLVEPVINKLGSSLGKKKLKELQDKTGAKTKAGEALVYASGLTGIGSFVMALPAL